MLCAQRKERSARACVYSFQVLSIRKRFQHATHRYHNPDNKKRNPLARKAMSPTRKTETRPIERIPGKSGLMRYILAAVLSSTTSMAVAPCSLLLFKERRGDEHGNESHAYNDYGKKNPNHYDEVFAHVCNWIHPHGIQSELQPSRQLRNKNKSPTHLQNVIAISLDCLLSAQERFIPSPNDTPKIAFVCTTLGAAPARDGS